MAQSVGCRKRTKDPHQSTDLIVVILQSVNRYNFRDGARHGKMALAASRIMQSKQHNVPSGQTRPKEEAALRIRLPFNFM